MKKIKGGQLELAILTEIGAANRLTVKTASSGDSARSAVADVTVLPKIATKEDEEIYRGIVSRYYKSIA
ncbi:hypothetical protein [Pectobacterium versatile]|uniref:hypothetical protein n=1 Tax=Pectobacterium versatile TaxID=2488639 RepID=UPI00301642AD